MKLLAFAILLVLSFTLILTSVHYSLPSSVSSSVNGSSLGTWWNGDWSYRKFHFIGNASNAGAGYAVQITAINGSGADTGNSVHVDNKSRPDFGDLRFVSNDNVTLLDYWMESVNYGQNATMWVKIAEDLSLSPTTIWMYYGNPLATNLSNGFNTFVVFDDFEQDNINTALWTIEGNVQTSNEYSFAGSRCMKQSGSYSRIILKTMPLASNFSVCAYFQDVQPPNNVSSVLVVDNHSPVSLMLDGLDNDIGRSTSNYIYRIDSNNGDKVYYDSNIARTDAFHKMEIQLTDLAYSFIDGIIQPIQGAFNGADRIYIGNPWGNNASYGYWDTFYLRKCVNPEPAQSGWGQEAGVLLGDAPSPMASNSLILFGKGARWASPNASNALYVDFYDNLIAHPNPTVFPCYGPDFFLPQRDAIANALEKQGFNLIFSGDIPSNLSGYGLLVIDAYWACNANNAPQIESYVSKGGGVVLIRGVPCYLSTYSTIWSTGTSLDAIREWFGAGIYCDTTGMAHVVVDNPLGSSLKSGDLLLDWDNGARAAVNGLSNNSMVLATWDDGNVLGFAHAYGQGRVYYQAEYQQSPVADFETIRVSPDNPSSEDQVNVTVTFANADVNTTMLFCSGASYEMTKNADGTFSTTLPPTVQGGQIQFQMSATDVSGNWIVSNMYSYSVPVPSPVSRQAGPVYFSVEPVPVGSLTDINGSVNGLDMPPLPSPVGENFTVEIHLRNATATNVPNGVDGVEVHLFFGNILDYCKPIGFIDELGQTGGALVGPVTYALEGFYDDNGNPIANSPYANATQYLVAAATTTGGWNGNDGLIARITFQITRQPSQNMSQPDFYAPLQVGFANIVDSNSNNIPFSVAQGTLRISTDPPALMGDLNGDGNINPRDLLLLAHAYNSKPGAPHWNPNADFDGNGVVGLADLVTLAMHYGQRYS